MSLTVTVQKGHDFSSGNVTRAALNAGAVPTVAVTGSVGTSELGADVVTATELKSSSDDDSVRAVTTNHIKDSAVTTAKIADDAVNLDKINYSSVKGAIIKTGDNAAADAIVPTVLEAKTAGKILIGDGVDLLSLGHQSGNVDDNTVTATQPKSHIEIAVEPRVSSTPSTGVLLTLKDFAIKVAKLAKNKVADALTPGVIVYGGDGVASVLASTGTDSKVLTTNNTAAPSFKISNKIIDVKNPLDSSITSATDSTGYISENNIFVAEHGITSGTPIITGMFFQCIADDNGYVAGDRYYDIKGHDLNHEAYFFVEGDNVGVYLQYQPKSYTKEDAFQGTPTGRAFLTPSKWKVCVTVSEV